jgi:hypothetical protein
MFESVTKMFNTKKFNDVFEKYDIEFNNRTLTNGIFLLGNGDELKQESLQKIVMHTIEKGYGLIYVATKGNDFIDNVESFVTKTRNTRRHHPVSGDMSSINALSLTSEMQHAKIVEIALQKFDASDVDVVYERLNLQFKKLFHDMYTNFKAYPKKEGLRFVVLVDSYDEKHLKAFTNMEFFQTMKDYDVGFVFCVEKDYFQSKLNPHKEHLKEIPRFNMFEC